MTADTIDRIHFIGIGGVGMSGIAHVAADQGIQVSGSDLKESRYTEQLREQGIQVFIGQDAANVPEGNVAVVVSTAISPSNPEYAAAQQRGLHIWHRAQMLAYLGRSLKTLAVTGTHGKTTTSSMLASVLDAMGQDPTFLIGGMVRAYNTNAHSGAGEYYVVEADESDKSFTHLSPHAVLVTNIEADHLDHYRDLDEIYEKFDLFMRSVPADQGVIVACGDDQPLTRLAKATDCRVVTYGFAESCDVRIVDYASQGVGSVFALLLPDGTRVDTRVKQNPGAHNVSNAAGVIALLWALGYDPKAAADAMADFAGVGRRFDLVGVQSGVTVVDDYAHHPTEIAATIGSAAELDFKRVHVLFQPHRYSRVKLFTEVLKDDFARAFDAADSLVFMDVFPAGEAPVPGVDGQTFLKTVLDHDGHPVDSAFIADRDDIVSAIADRAQDGDLVITMGAGDVTSMGPRILEALKARDASN